MESGVKPMKEKSDRRLTFYTLKYLTLKIITDRVICLKKHPFSDFL